MNMRLRNFSIKPFNQISKDLMFPQQSVPSDGFFAMKALRQQLRLPEWWKTEWYHCGISSKNGSHGCLEIFKNICIDLSVLKNICWNSWRNMRKTNRTLEESPIFNWKYIFEWWVFPLTSDLNPKFQADPQLRLLTQYSNDRPLGPWHFSLSGDFNAFNFSKIQWQNTWISPLKIWSCEKTWT